MISKQTVADWLQRAPLLRWGLKVGVKLFIRRHYVGAVGAIFNEAGQVLLVKHVFRPDYPWGLPGGWVEPGENPADAVQREVKEELNLQIEVKQLLFCELQGGKADASTPLGLGLGYYCRLATGESIDQIPSTAGAFEVLGLEWVDPDQIKWNLVALQRKAIRLGKIEFERERTSS